MIRKVKFLLKPLIIFLLLVQCQPKGSTEYVIVNATAYDVKIKGFERISHFEDGNPIYKEELFAENIHIPANSQFSSTYFHASGTYQSGAFKRQNVDSVCIVFNQEKIIEQFCEQPLEFGSCSIVRNIMDFGKQYIFEQIKKDDGRYTYTITDEDYERAEPIVETLHL